MSRKSEIIAAIDICTAKTVVVIGRKDDQGTVEIISYSKVNSQGVKRGVIYNIEEAVSSVREALTKARRNYNGPISKVFVGINGQHLYSESVDGVKELDNARYIRKEDVAELIKGAQSVELHPGETIYDVVPQYYRVNNEDSILNPVGVYGNDVFGEFKLILGPESYAKNTCFCIEKAGLNLSDISISPIAAGDAVLTDDEKEAGVVLVDFGSGITNVSVYYDKILRHVGIIPFGGEVITRDIKEGCSILLRQAEALKVQYGSALGDNAPDDKVVTIPG
ncbi:MAG: cell division protein FtsA, partial [Bacteroidota bacterium]|nr:cell division protein FtsA [Bacteroidota bacterium]